MVKNTAPKNIYLLIILGFFYLAGCSQAASPTTASQPISITRLAQETHDTPIPDNPTPNTPKPPTVAPTTAASPATGLTPLPTLNSDAARQEIARLMETNNGCLGACFWGIVPGEIDFDQAVRYLKTLKDKGLKETKDSYISGYQYKDNEITISLEISALKGKVQNLDATVVGLEFPNVTGKDWLAFRPDSFLKANGIPKQVNIIMSEGPEGRVGYEMILLYDQMYVRYTGNQIIVKPEHILHACPLVDQNIQRVELWLGPYDKQTQNDGVDLTWLTALSSNDLFEILVGTPEDACFDLDYQKIYPSK
jgi:hypothetical protein